MIHVHTADRQHSKIAQFADKLRWYFIDHPFAHSRPISLPRRSVRLYCGMSESCRQRVNIVTYLQIICNEFTSYKYNDLRRRFPLPERSATSTKRSFVQKSLFHFFSDPWIRDPSIQTTPVTWLLSCCGGGHRREATAIPIKIHSEAQVSKRTCTLREERASARERVR